MNVTQAAAMLGVSTRLVYDLAAPAGPIPCKRVGRPGSTKPRIVFDESDIREYQESCRYTATVNVVRSSLNLAVASTVGESSGHTWRRTQVIDSIGVTVIASSA